LANNLSPNNRFSSTLILSNITSNFHTRICHIIIIIIFIWMCEIEI
jgi:hypothetical protein